MPRQNKGPYLSDRPNSFGLYEVCWTENGRSKRKSTGTGERRAAQRYYAEFLLSASDGEVGAGGITVTKCIDAYLADKTNVVNKRGQEADFGHLRTHFGDILVSELDQADVDRYIEARGKGLVTYTNEAGRVCGGGSSKPSTTRGEVGMLQTAIRHCIRKRKFKGPDGQVLLKPAHQPVLDLPAGPLPRERWLSRDEAAALLAACLVYEPGTRDPGRAPRVYRYVATMLYTAARRASVVKLTWDRIQLEHDPEQHKAGNYGMVNFRAPGEPRTRKRRGWVPIAGGLYPILKQAEEERRNEWFLDRPTLPYHPFARAAQRAGLVDKEGTPTVTPHTLRHTWATWAAQDGVPLYEIAGVLHDSVATVEAHYAHHAPEHLRGAVNRKLLEAA